MSETRVDGTIIIYSYDALNGLSAVHFPDPAEDITLSYDQGTPMANGPLIIGGSPHAKAYHGGKR